MYVVYITNLVSYTTLLPLKETPAGNSYSYIVYVVIYSDKYSMYSDI